MSAKCYDCGIPYGEGAFGDLVIPNEIWEMLNPASYKGGGLLCPNCIFQRIRYIRTEDRPAGIEATIYAPYYKRKRERKKK